MNREKKKVTILIPTYNRFDISQAVISCYRQSYNFTKEDIYNCRANFIIYDDGSTIKSPDLQRGSFTRLRYKSQQENLKIIRGEENRGIPYSRNLLLDMCDTEFGAWQDDDDNSDSKRIEMQMKYMQENPDCNFCCTLMNDYPIQRKEVEDHESISSLTYEKLLICNEIPNPTVLFRTSIAKKFRYNENLQRGSDWDYWKQVYKAGYKVECISEIPLYNYHVRDINQ